MSDDVKKVQSLHQDNKVTVGALAREAMKQEAEKVNLIEYGQAVQDPKKYYETLQDSVDKGIKKFPDQDFYIEVVDRFDKMLKNVGVTQFVVCMVCPTPTYDTSVWRYRNDIKDIEYLWTVPDKRICELFKDNFLDIIPDEQPLLEQVLKFTSGELLQMAKKLNGEVEAPGVTLKNTRSVHVVS